MRRLQLVVLSLLVAVVAIGIVVPVTTTEAHNGGLDLNQYCLSHGFAYAYVAEWNAYGWKCVAWDGSWHDMNLNQACVEQHGSGHHAEYSDFSTPYSWYCTHDAPPPPPPTGPIWCQVQMDARDLGGGTATDKNYVVEWRGPNLVNQVTNNQLYLYYNNSWIALAWHGNFDGANRWGVSTSWAYLHPGWQDDWRWRLDFLWDGTTCP